MRVQVAAYDLTRGMAAAMSPMLLGYQIEAVWHTGVVLDGRTELFFGYGINRACAGATPHMFGQPLRVLDMGETEVTLELLEELLADLAPRFRPQQYHLLFHNCNHFSNELVQLLTGQSLPDYIMNQAEHLFNSPWGETLMPVVMAMEGFTGAAGAQGFATASGTPPPPAPAAAPAQAAATAAAAAALPAAATAAAAPRVEAPPGASAPAAAATAAGMAAVARTAQQQQQVAGAPSSSQATGQAGGSSGGHQPDAAAAAAADKASEGVAGLSLTADSRASAAPADSQAS